MRWIWPTWTHCKIYVGKSFSLPQSSSSHGFLLIWLDFAPEILLYNSKCDHLFFSGIKILDSCCTKSNKLLLTQTRQHKIKLCVSSDFIEFLVVLDGKHNYQLRINLQYGHIRPHILYKDKDNGFFLIEETCFVGGKGQCKKFSLTYDKDKVLPFSSCGRPWQVALPQTPSFLRSPSSAMASLIHWTTNQDRQAIRAH